MQESVTRTLSGIVYILLLISATLYSEYSFSLLFGIFMLIAVVEFCRLIHLKSSLPILLALASYMVFVFFQKANSGANIFIVLAALFVSLNLLVDLFSNSLRPKTDKLDKFVKLFGYIILPFVLLMKTPYVTGAFEPEIIIGIFILIWTNDTFAYIIGKTLGKHKLLEHISPKKTFEGFIGGLVFTLIGSYILSHFYTVFTSLIWICTGLLAVLFGTLGDLIESKFKRSAGVKDSGKIMPGHGGILDRLDSIIFAIPFLYFFYLILNYVYTIS